MSSSYLDGFLQCLDEERFYEAHDLLEHIWFPRRFEKSDEMNLLKGYINAAVSFELIKRGREVSAQKVYNVYLKYKDLRLHVDSPYAKKYEEIESKIESIKKKEVSGV
ncbi:DUF309 domain-containing protein [bacterium]|nr:DUF309 domain-containing protein [bacterium]MBU1884549.1 DUF309 domain-containing protein [bacterium]